MNTLLDFNALLPALLGALVGSLLTWVVIARSANRATSQQIDAHHAALASQRDKLIQHHAQQLQALEQRHDDQLKKVESPLTVTIYPFVDAAEKRGFLKKTATLEIGYKYQLMVQGIPCMEPHRVVVETQTKVELDDQAIKAFGEKALALAEAAAQVKGGGIAATLISVAKTVVARK
jgi:hypothetical protein